MQRSWLQLALLLVASACTGERWVIGELLADAGATLSLPDAASPRCAPPARDALPEPLPPALIGAEHTGRWRAILSGEEAAKFPAGPVEVWLAPGSAVLRFESGVALPLLLDPRAGYLCRAPGASTCATESGLVGDFDYALAVSARGSILSTSLFLEQPWDEWCRAQPPVEQSMPGCEPGYDVELAYTATSWAESCRVLRDEQWFGIDCDRLATVERRPCACSADGCRAASRAQLLNLRRVASDELEGALWFASDRAQVLRFVRVPEAQ